MRPDLTIIERRALALMRKLGEQHLDRSLQDLGWRFQFDRARRRLGLCEWQTHPVSKKVISLSRFLASSGGWLLMEDVVRHEIAHALDFETRGRSAHDRVWKRWARLCGADPTRTYDGELGDDPSSPFVGQCLEASCAYVRPFYRSVTAAYYCPRCNGVGTRTFLRIRERSTGRIVRAGGAEPGPVGLTRPPPYLARCPACGHTRPFARRPRRRYACGPCCQRHAGGRFDKRFELALERRR